MTAADIFDSDIYGAILMLKFASCKLRTVQGRRACPPIRLHVPGGFFDRQEEQGIGGTAFGRGVERDRHQHGGALRVGPRCRRRQNLPAGGGGIRIQIVTVVGYTRVVGWMKVMEGLCRRGEKVERRGG